MKYFLFFSFVFVVSCCFAAPSTSLTSNEIEVREKQSELVEKVNIQAQTQEEFYRERINKLFENFTDAFQDSHPSIAAPIKAVTTCIEENGLLDGLKYWLIAQKSLSGSTLAKRKTINKFFSNIHDRIYQCINEAATPENENFIAALSTSVKLLFNSVSVYEDGLEMFSMIEDNLAQKFLTREEYFPIKQIAFLIRHNIAPTESQNCLPLRVAEAIELAMIKERKIPFKFRGKMAIVAQIVATITGKFPFKTLKECSSIFIVVLEFVLYLINF